MSAVWHAGPRLGFDVESTGVDVFNDRVVTASLVHVQPDARPQVTSWLINPGVEISAEATAVHGISTEHARQHGRPPAEVIDIVTADLAIAMHRGTPAVIFNASFDLSLLEAENRRHGLPTLAERLGGVIRNVIDPFVIDREVDKYRRGKRTLPVLCEYYGVTLTGAHDSSADALAAVRVAGVLVARHASLRNLTLDELHNAQAVWHAERQADYAAYLARQGKDNSEVDGSWPVRQAPAEVPA